MRPVLESREVANGVGKSSDKAFRSWPTLAKTDFGQNRLSPKPTFGQIEFDLLCVVVVFVCVVWCGVCVVCVLCGVGACFSVSWSGVSHVGVGFKLLVWSCMVLPDRPSRDRPSRDRPSRGPPKISLFFPSPAAKFVLFFPLWGSSRGILVVFFESRDPQMCTCGVLWLSCEAPAAPKPAHFRAGDTLKANRRPSCSDDSRPSCCRLPRPSGPRCCR